MSTVTPAEIKAVFTNALSYLQDDPKFIELWQAQNGLEGHTRIEQVPETCGTFGYIVAIDRDWPVGDLTPEENAVFEYAQQHMRTALDSFMGATIEKDPPAR